MRNRNTNIFLRGTAILLLIVATVLTISSLVGYSRQRNNYPPGMTIGDVPVGGLDPQAASQRVLQVYSTPIEIQYGGGTIQVEPAKYRLPDGPRIRCSRPQIWLARAAPSGADFGIICGTVIRRPKRCRSAPLSTKSGSVSYLQNEIAPAL